MNSKNISIEKNLCRYILPNMMAMLGLSIYILADTFFISLAEGINGVAALNLALPVYGLMFAIGSMIGIGSATRYNLLNSRGDKNAEQFFSNSIITTVLISLIFVAAGMFAADKVLAVMGADTRILEIGTVYMRIVLCFAPAFMLNYSFTSFIRNDNAPNLAMAATLSSSFFNIAFDYIFMFPMNMGMVGAALATGISPVISMLICSMHFLSKSNNIRFVKKAPSLKKLMLACTLGVSGFVGEISGAVTCLAFNFILLALSGNTAVAAYGVIANLSLVSIAFFNGVSQGLQPMASSAEGKGNNDAKKRILIFSVGMGLAISILLVLISYIFTTDIINVFNSENSAELERMAFTGLRIYSIGFIPAAVNIVNSGFLSATGRAKECTVISVLRGIAAIIFFAFVLSRFLGVLGVWIAFPASEIATLIVSLFISRKDKQR